MEEGLFTPLYPLVVYCSLRILVLHVSLFTLVRRRPSPPLPPGTLLLTLDPSTALSLFILVRRRPSPPLPPGTVLLYPDPGTAPPSLHPSTASHAAHTSTPNPSPLFLSDLRSSLFSDD